MINLWQWHDNTGLYNFGDQLTKYVLEYILEKTIRTTDLNNANFVGAGSILEIVLKQANRNDLTVWGSGFISAGNNVKSNLKFLAVRGVLSQRRLNINVPIGDPGLLMRYIIPAQKKKWWLGIVPHYVDRHNEVVQQAPNGVRIINVWQNPIKVSSEIAACEIILSSSLHGLIVADSMNIPNARITLSNKLTGGDYKFLDYYSALGINHVLCIKQTHIYNKKTLENMANRYSRPGIDVVTNNLRQVIIDEYG
jgi:pyruvyltransferase